MDLLTIAKRIETDTDFAQFLDEFLKDFQLDNKNWENTDIERYFGAMKAYIEDSLKNPSSKMIFQPSWSVFATLMVIASMYE